MPNSAPIATIHAVVVRLLGSKQLRQNPPPEGWLAMGCTCIGTDWVLFQVGSFVSVAVNVTMNV